MTAPAGVGIVGCGSISATYLRNLATMPGVRVVAVTDLDAERAQRAAAEHGVAAEPSLSSLLGRDDVDVVCNLTVPAAHADVCLEAIAAGKHVYVEKPLAATRARACELLSAAAERGVLVGGAPDTFLGPALQLSRHLVDGGRIGRPVSAAAEWTSPGHESWHPDADFYYRHGGGPLLDMGPYYLTALVSLLGPVTSVAATATRAKPQRTLGTGPRAGERVDVEVATHVSGLLQFAGGETGTITMSFDVPGPRPPRLDVHGTDGSLHCADPNLFAGPVRLVRADGVDETHAGGPADRGIGLADLAEAAVSGRAPRASGALAFHVLDVMESLVEAADVAQWVTVQSSVERPEPLA